MDDNNFEAVNDILQKLKTSLPVCRICLEVSMEYIDCEDTLCVLENGREVTFYQGYAEITQDEKYSFNAMLPKNFCENCARELLNAYSFIKRIEYANYVLDKLNSLTKESLKNQMNKNDLEGHQQTKNGVDFSAPEECVSEVSIIKSESPFEEDCENYEELYTLDGAVENEDLDIETETPSSVNQNAMMFVCHDCGYLCVSEEEFESHKQLLHEKESDDSTHTDNQPVIDNPECTREISQQNKDKNYTCDICSCAFETKRDFNIHKIRVHDTNQRNQQDYSQAEPNEELNCQKLVPDIPIETHLKENVESPAKKIGPKQIKYTRTKINSSRYACHICGKVCLKPFSLKKHIQHIHMSERKKYQCENCGLFFQFPSNLNEHRRKHNETNQYKCANCERTFLRKKQLEIHMRYHLNDFPHKCDNCDKCYATKSNLNDHIRASHMEITYDCDKCKQTFRSQTGLRKHKYTHDGYPFKCPLCGIGQTSRSGMKKHLMGVHKDAVTEEEFDVMFPIINPKTGYRRPKELLHKQ